MKILRVGDPHVQHNNIAESNRLFEFVLQIAIQYKIDRIEILGDLNHNHAVVRVECLEFWHYWLKKLSQSFETIVLVGNHDFKGDYSSNSHSLSVFKYIDSNRLFIVDQPFIPYLDISGTSSIGYMPYYHDKEKFIEHANNLYDLGVKVLVCHQTFNGGKYESGIYAPDGVDLSLIKMPLIISGHLHTAQRFGNVIYPGTGRWLTNSDANIEKGLWLVEHDSYTGQIQKEEFIDTSNVCIPIHKFQWLEGQEMPKLVPNAKTNIELVGNSNWVEKQKLLLKGKCSISTKLTDNKRLRWKPKHTFSIESFIKEQFQVSSGLSKEDLIRFMGVEGLI